MRGAIEGRRCSRRKGLVRFLGAACIVGFVSITGCRSVQSEGQPSPTEREGIWSAYSVEPPPAAPRAAPKPRYSEVLVDGPYVALTFDDGPHARLTPQLLDILKEHQIPATFFVVGRQVAAHPHILRRIAAEGHEIGNHTWDHRALDGMDTASARVQLEKTNNVIKAVAGQAPTIMRPPYGKTNPHLNQWIFDQLGLKVIMWSVDSSDWRHRDADLVRLEILSGAKSGAIILSHDTQPSTVAAMATTLEALRAEGFRFVTVSELIALER